MSNLILYLLAMVGGLTIILAIMFLFAYVLTLLGREDKNDNV